MNKISLFFLELFFLLSGFFAKMNFLETIRTKHSLWQKDNVILMLLSGLDSRPLNKLNLQSLSGSWSVPIDRRYVICPSIICPTHHLSYTVGENFICPTHHAFVLHAFVLHIICFTERRYHCLFYTSIILFTSIVLRRERNIICPTIVLQRYNDFPEMDNIICSIVMFKKLNLISFYMFNNMLSSHLILD